MPLVQYLYSFNQISDLLLFLIILRLSFAFTFLLVLTTAIFSSISECNYPKYLLPHSLLPLVRCFYPMTSLQTTSIHHCLLYSHLDHSTSNQFFNNFYFKISCIASIHLIPLFVFPSIPTFITLIFFTSSTFNLAAKLF